MVSPNQLTSLTGNPPHSPGRLQCQHGGKIICCLLRKAEGFLSLRHALMWVLNWGEFSQMSKQGCIIHLQSALVTAGIQLYCAVWPSASLFSQKTGKLCQKHTKPKNLVVTQSVLQAVLVHTSPVKSCPHLRALSASRAQPAPNCVWWGSN